MNILGLIPARYAPTSFRDEALRSDHQRLPILPLPIAFDVRGLP